MKLEEKACNLILIVYFNCDLQYVFLSFFIVVAVNNLSKHMYIEQSSNSSINIHAFPDAGTVGLKRRLFKGLPSICFASFCMYQSSFLIRYTH